VNDFGFEKRNNMFRIYLEFRSTLDRKFRALAQHGTSANIIQDWNI